jgi:hypothetical protein
MRGPLGNFAHGAEGHDLLRIQDQRKRTIIGIKDEITRVGVQMGMIRMGKQVRFTRGYGNLSGELHRPAE